MLDKKTRVIKVADVPAMQGSSYPALHAEAVAGRAKQRLGDAVGVTSFGVNMVRLPVGCASSQRHWHSRQDEFVLVLEGELVLVTNDGEQTLTTGMAAGFQAASGDGHHLVNRSGGDAVYLEVGDRSAGDEADYPDIDMQVRYVDGVRKYVHRNGEPY
jgi:uncharacterized cupin superfamily protein